MEEKTEAVKGEETTVGLTMNYNPFSFISCQEDALVLAGCISHGLDADVIKKSGDLFATARAMLLDACVCLLYRQGGDSMSMQGLVDLLQNDILAWILATLFRCFRYLPLGFSPLRAPFLRESQRCSRASLRSYFLRWRGFSIFVPSERVASVSTPRSIPTSRSVAVVSLAGTSVQRKVAK